MSATAIQQNSTARFEKREPGCRILILHEDFSAYTSAVEVCRRVMEQFARELDFDIKCWSFIELADPDCARHAAKAAGVADIFLLASHATALPEQLERWLNVACIGRVKEDGVLALVLDDPNASPAALEKLRLRLQMSAARLGVDFLALFPGDEAAVEAPRMRGWPALARAREAAEWPVADHWGLNE